MKLLFLLLACIISTSANKCNGVLFDQRYYEPQILKDGLNRVRQLVFNRKDNDIYFLYNQDGVRIVEDMKDYTADSFVVDGDGNMLFTNGKKLFKIKLGTRSPAFELVTRTVTALSKDIEDRLFAASLDGIFVYNKYKFALDKISNLHEIKALTFNNMLEPIYVVFDLLVKLKNPVNCVEDTFFV
ncbi:uncharacterized protein LOC113513603 isoform X2 [Galleria mellonella]|uniref:Uncharacterized protein LOC113513603 isoform X2 n=1 Tax=Galleria mellonella TaxID=7137 RepID=A0ABM3MA08_GALME|nr:uncharacterized protein LOC113513603 isoform X2 [Galleria mellonella]